jgi:hypothetical protein
VGDGVTGWDLYSTLVEQSQYVTYYKSIPPVACPHDGTPLRLGPPQRPGVLYCPNGDFVYPDDYDAESMAGF